MEITTLTGKIKTHLEPILNESGSIIFSSVETIAKGDIYTLGLNPGGGAFIPIRNIISQLPLKIWNAYIDESWENNKKTYKVGQHPLQINFVGLVKAIGYDPATVFSTNLIFSRSRDQNGAKYPSNANICWPVHREFIKIVDPKYIIAFGNSRVSPFQFIKDKYPLDKKGSIHSGHGQWKCYWYTGEIEGKERHLIGLPHLSRYYIIYHRDVINWVKSIIKAR